MSFPAYCIGSSSAVGFSQEDTQDCSVERLGLTLFLCSSMLQVDSEQPLAAAPLPFRGAGGGVDVCPGHPQQFVLPVVRVSLRRTGEADRFVAVDFVSTQTGVRRSVLSSCLAVEEIFYDICWQQRPTKPRQW